MEADRFDHLARTFSSSGTRRGVLRLLFISLPVPVLALLTGEDESQARRQGRDKDRGKHRNESSVGSDNHKRKGRRRKHKNHRRHDEKKRCRPESPAATCTGQCGTVLNNCEKPVDCGSCSCDPPCAVCRTCDANTGQCVADPALVGQDCGNGRLCQENGACICTATSCGSGAICCEGECRTCPTPPNSTAACATGGCFFFCNEGFHRCGECCVADSSPLTCGVRCTPCPPGEDCDGTDCACGGGPSCGEGGVCCGGQCCPAGQLCDGSGNCVAPSACCSGSATCGAVSSAGWLCCEAPRAAACCCESAPGAGDGVVRCCDPDDENCLSGCGAPFAVGGAASADCSVQGGDATVSCATCGAG